MHQLNDLIEQLAAAVVMADPLDLTGLAELHSKFQDVQKCDAGAETPVEVIERARKSAGDAEKLVERIILQEVDDTGAALKELARHVDDLQHIANGTFKEANDAAVQGALPTQASSNSAHDQPQQAFSGEDVPMIAEFVAEAREHIASAE